MQDSLKGNVTAFENKNTISALNGVNRINTGYTKTQYISNIPGSQWVVLSAASWDAREQPAMAVFNNKIWLLGGKNGSGSYLNDIWTYTEP
jgi:hypothetical protein